MVILSLKQVVTWTGNLKETGDIENKLDKTSEPDGALKDFTKITVSAQRKIYFLGRPHDCEVIQIFMLFCKGGTKCGRKKFT